MDLTCPQEVIIITTCRVRSKSFLINLVSRHHGNMLYISVVVSCEAGTIPTEKKVVFHLNICSLCFWIEVTLFMIKYAFKIS